MENSNGIVVPVTQAYAYDFLKEATLELGRKWYESGDFDLNMGGVRLVLDTDHFDDAQFVACTVAGRKMVRIWPTTTDPGFYWLTKKRNMGCAILVPRQYSGMWILGKHRQSYEALVHRDRTVQLYRDYNRDVRHDLSKATVENADFSINNHHSGDKSPPQPDVPERVLSDDDIKKVAAASAACQVFQNRDDHQESLMFAHAQFRHHPGWGERVSYNLMTAIPDPLERHLPRLAQVSGWRGLLLAG